MTRRNVIALGGGLAVALLLLSLTVLRDHPGARAATATSGVGGTISIGTVTSDGTTMDVPIDTTATTDTYIGANATLTWDTSLLSFASADVTGSTLATAAGGAGNVLCLGGAYSGAGGTGEEQSCSVFSGSTAAAGTLITFHLNVDAVGCTTLHIVTYDTPDNGDTTFGQYTIDEASGEPQATTAGPDVDVNTDDASVCTADTPTPTSTATATDTPAPVNSPTQTQTPFGGLRTITPSPTPPVSATPGPSDETPAPPPRRRSPPTAERRAAHPAGRVERRAARSRCRTPDPAVRDRRHRWRCLLPRW